MKTMACLLTIWMMTALSAQAAPLPEADWYAAAMDGPLNAFCVDGDAIYLLRENELWLADGELNPVERAHVFVQAVKGVCVEQGAVYFAWRDGEKVRFSRSLPGADAETLFSVPAADRLLEIEVRDEIVIVQWRPSAEEYMQGNGNHGRRIELYDINGRMLAQAFGADAAFCGEDILLLGDDELMRWELATGEMHPIGVGYGYAVAVTQDGKTAYIWGDGQNEDGKLLITRCDLSGGQVELLPDAEWLAYSDFANLVCTADSLIGYEIRSGSFFVGSEDRGVLPPQIWSLQELPVERRVLNLVSYDRGYPWMSEEMDAAMAMFRALHPEVEIRVTAMESEQIVTSLLSGDGGIDVLYLNSLDAYDMAQAGALLDLNSDAKLRAELETWIGSEAMVLDGMRYGATLQINPLMLVANEEIAQFAPEIDWQNDDWLEIFRAAEHMQTDLNGDGSQDVWFLWDFADAPLWFGQYIDSFEQPEDIDFDTEYFRELAQQYKRCAQQGLILEAGANFEQRDLAAYQFGYAARSLDGAEFCPAPLIDGRKVVSGSTHSLAVPRSADADLALDFLRCYAGDEVQQSGYSIGYKADSSLYAEYAQMTPTQRENLAAHAAYVDQVRTKWNNSDFNRHASGEMARYLADEISLGEMVNSLQQKLRMVIWG